MKWRTKLIRKAGGSEMVNVVYLMKHTQIINLQSPTKKKPQTKYLERAIFQVTGLLIRVLRSQELFIGRVPVEESANT